MDDDDDDDDAGEVRDDICRRHAWTRSAEPGALAIPPYPRKGGGVGRDRFRWGCFSIPGWGWVLYSLLS
jgi:hypothetical protein